MSDQSTSDSLDILQYYLHVGSGRLKLLHRLIGDFSDDTEDSIWTLFEESVGTDEQVKQFRSKPKRFFFVIRKGAIDMVPHTGMVAVLVDVVIENKATGEQRNTTVGVVGDWQDGMENTELDKQVFFWFDTVDDIVPGADMGDDLIVTIKSEPYIKYESFTAYEEKADK